MAEKVILRNQGRPNSRFISDGMNQKFRRYDHGGKEAGGGIKQPKTGLFADVGDMAEIPGDEVIDLVIGREGDVDRVGDVLAVKDAAFDVAFCEDGDFLGEVELFERFDQVETAGTVRFCDSFELALDEY